MPVYESGACESSTKQSVSETLPSRPRPARAPLPEVELGLQRRRCRVRMAAAAWGRTRGQTAPLLVVTGPASESAPEIAAAMGMSDQSPATLP